MSHGGAAHCYGTSWAVLTKRRWVETARGGERTIEQEGKQETQDAQLPRADAVDGRGFPQECWIGNDNDAVQQGELPILIRESTQADISDILGCLWKAFRAYCESYTPSAFGRYGTVSQMFEAPHGADARTRGNNSADQIVGTIAQQIDEGAHIRGMAVIPAAQDPGVAIQAARQACLRITLDTTLGGDIGPPTRNSSQISFSWTSAPYKD